MTEEDLKFAVVALSAMFFVIDPLANVPIFLSSRRATPEQRRRTALRAAFAAWILLFAFAVAGGVIFQAFGISLGAFKIAGGMMLLLMSIDMMRAQTSRTRTTEEEQRESQARDDIAIFPLAIPMLAGPGAIATVMVLMSRAAWEPIATALVFIAVTITCLAAWLLMRSAANADACCRRRCSARSSASWGCCWRPSPSSSSPAASRTSSRQSDRMLRTCVTSSGVLRAIAVGCVLTVGCAKATAPVEKPRPRTEPTSSFAQRPLKIEVEGTSEKRQRFDVTFVGFEVVGPYGQGDMRVIAQALNRYLNLQVAQVSPPLAAQCNTFKPDCMVGVGALLNARQLLWGTSHFDKGAMKASLFVLDVSSKRILREWTEPMLLMESLSHEGARQLVERGRLAVLGADESTLLVESDVDGTVYVDGVSHGKLAVPRTSVRLRPGKHRIKIVSHGFSSTEKELEIPASHFVRVVVKK